MPASAHEPTELGEAACATAAPHQIRPPLATRAFTFDVLVCPRCGGRLRLIALIEEAAVIGRILGHLGVPTDLPVAGPARAPPLIAASAGAQDAHYEPAL